ncbi:alkaline phosphatase-like protein [Dacryopinax primogenitus]|uniref:Alkaline phosphatase-like protein n=1 Tax=Dacryopinax primogenitus (strain DJM 731) TaxID=1858805 RepID=M5FXF7_DACPD|nr:alkaline phosphatase-like protein [Dacryopinax primogenitus]EJU02671.1 alkaline phosphatase-like protein [Dacryopinax primogenitus]
MSPPNILFIMADDHAAKAISCYGAGINHTPHLDRVAKEGMKFNHCYVTNSICTPSRAAILTGTHNHVNNVLTLSSKIDKRLPNVAKSLRSGGYQTAMVGKWHLGEGEAHEPSGFDFWSVINWIEKRDRNRPFFLMCHHKAPHRSWEFNPKHGQLYTDPVRVPETFDDDYKNRAKAAAEAKMKVGTDMTYLDLGLAQPDGGNEVGERLIVGSSSNWDRKVPDPEDVTTMRPLIDKHTGEMFTFKTRAELKNFKFQRYMQRYLRTIQSVDDNVGRLLDYLDKEGLTENTIVIYTSDQGFFLGEHGWFDKRFIYEESFQMPFLIRYPREIKPGTVCDDIIQNVDFAPTWLDFAGPPIPNYMQGYSFRSLLQNQTPSSWKQVAYHRYWMHRDDIHNAYAHYGVRNQRYKLIYWYNEGFELAGTNHGGQDKEWELFDCEKDPLELLNVFGESGYAQVVKQLMKELDDKMAEIGDEPAHVPYYALTANGK